VHGARVTPNLFQLLETHAEIGRVLGPVDGESTSTRVAVLGHVCWRERFNADPAMVSRNRPHGRRGLHGRRLVLTPDDAAKRRPTHLVGLGRLRQDSLWLVQVTIGYGRASKVCVGGSP
jgi:hypothetical protein